MWLKFFLLSLIVTTSKAATSIKSLTDISKHVQDIAIQDHYSNFSDISNIINEVLKTFNLSDIKVNIVLNHLEDSQQLDVKEFEKSLKYLFKTTITTNWQMKHMLQEIATAANNVTVYEILYEILWQELKNYHNKTNPFLYIELYEDLEWVLKNVTSNKLIKLQNEIQTGVVKCSAQVLQSYFIQNSTIKLLLAQLKSLNNVYHLTIPKVFENLDSIEDQWQIAKDLLNFDSQTKEAVLNHIGYIEYLTSRLEVIPYDLFKNLETLIARPDFINISLTQRQKAAQLLPLSMANLFAGQKICLRNTTTNYYLYECPQTYLMCTNLIANNRNPINRKKATFEIERLGNDQYALRSPYWGRHFHLQRSNSKNMPTTNNTSTNTTSISTITKNLYSHAEASPWLVRFQDDYATIQDSTGEFYVCGGNPSYWNNMEKYAYTRKSMSFYEKQYECLWLLENCSDVV